MSIKNEIKNRIKNEILIIDGAMGTQIQSLDIPQSAWIDDKGLKQEGCNELLNATAPNLISTIHNNYASSGADFIKTNTFGSMGWVLDEYDMGHRAYELTLKGTQIVREVCDKFNNSSE